jgi:hypothetical protein
MLFGITPFVVGIKLHAQPLSNDTILLSTYIFSIHTSVFIRIFLRSSTHVFLTYIFVYLYYHETP